jgi:uncharacterized protein involved in exopolysaccharide biosynthesis
MTNIKEKSPMPNQTKSQWYYLLLYILRFKKLNFTVVFLSFILSVVIAFFIMKKLYTSGVSILPSAASSSQGLTGKFSSLANLAGVNLGGSTTRSPEMYQGILTSRRLLEQVIYHEYSYRNDKESFTGNLIEFLEITGKSKEEYIQKALKKMRDHVLVSNIDPENQILYITITLSNPEISSQVANYIIEVLERLVLDKLQMEIKEQNDYLKNRLTTLNDSLKIAEEELKFFLERHPDPTLPSFQVEQLRLRRKIEVQSAVFIELTKQQELLYVQNFINLSPLKILDRAFPPYRKSRPKRLFVTITLFLLFSFLQLGVNSSFYIYGKFKSNVQADLKR